MSLFLQANTLLKQHKSDAYVKSKTLITAVSDFNGYNKHDAVGGSPALLVLHENLNLLLNTARLALKSLPTYTQEAQFECSISCLQLAVDIICSVVKLVETKGAVQLLKFLYHASSGASELLHQLSSSKYQQKKSKELLIIEYQAMILGLRSFYVLCDLIRQLYPELSSLGDTSYITFHQNNQQTVKSSRFWSEKVPIMGSADKVDKVDNNNCRINKELMDYKSIGKLLLGSCLSSISCLQTLLLLNGKYGRKLIKLHFMGLSEELREYLDGLTHDMNEMIVTIVDIRELARISAEWLPVLHDNNKANLPATIRNTSRICQALYRFIGTFVSSSKSIEYSSIPTDIKFDAILTRLCFKYFYQNDSFSVGKFISGYESMLIIRENFEECCAMAWKTVASAKGGNLANFHMKVGSFLDKCLDQSLSFSPSLDVPSYSEYCIWRCYFVVKNNLLKGYETVNNENQDPNILSPSVVGPWSSIFPGTNSRLLSLKDEVGVCVVSLLKSMDRVINQRSFSEEKGGNFLSFAKPFHKFLNSGHSMRRLERLWRLLNICQISSLRNLKPDQSKESLFIAGHILLDCYVPLGVLICFHVREFDYKNLDPILKLDVDDKSKLQAFETSVSSLAKGLSLLQVEISSDNNIKYLEAHLSLLEQLLHFNSNKMLATSIARTIGSIGQKWFFSEKSADLEILALSTLLFSSRIMSLNLCPEYEIPKRYSLLSNILLRHNRFAQATSILFEAVVTENELNQDIDIGPTFHNILLNQSWSDFRCQYIQRIVKLLLKQQENGFSAFTPFIENELLLIAKSNICSLDHFCDLLCQRIKNPLNLFKCCLSILSLLAECFDRAEDASHVSLEMLQTTFAKICRMLEGVCHRQIHLANLMKYACRIIIARRLVHDISVPVQSASSDSLDELFLKWRLSLIQECIAWAKDVDYSSIHEHIGMNISSSESTCLVNLASSKFLLLQHYSQSVNISNGDRVVSELLSEIQSTCHEVMKQYEYNPSLYLESIKTGLTALLAAISSWASFYGFDVTANQFISLYSNLVSLKEIDSKTFFQEIELYSSDIFLQLNNCEDERKKSKLALREGKSKFQSLDYLGQAQYIFGWKARLAVSLVESAEAFLRVGDRRRAEGYVMTAIDMINKDFPKKSTYSSLLDSVESGFSLRIADYTRRLAIMKVLGTVDRDILELQSEIDCNRKFVFASSMYEIDQKVEISYNLISRGDILRKVYSGNSPDFVSAYKRARDIMESAYEFIKNYKIQSECNESTTQTERKLMKLHMALKVRDARSLELFGKSEEGKMLYDEVRSSVFASNQDKAYSCYRLGRLSLQVAIDNGSLKDLWTKNNVEENMDLVKAQDLFLEAMQCTGPSSSSLYRRLLRCLALSFGPNTKENDNSLSASNLIHSSVGIASRYSLELKFRGHDTQEKSQQVQSFQKALREIDSENSFRTCINLMSSLLPRGWNCVGAVLSPTGHLMISSYRKDGDEIISNVACVFPENNTFDEFHENCLRKLQNILEDNRLHLSSMDDFSVNSSYDKNDVKRQWWEKRKENDEKLQVLLENTEERFFSSSEVKQCLLNEEAVLMSEEQCLSEVQDLTKRFEAVLNVCEDSHEDAAPHFSLKEIDSMTVVKLKEALESLGVSKKSFRSLRKAELRELLIKKNAENSASQIYPIQTEKDDGVYSHQDEEQQESQATILILDEHLHRLPWERLPCLQNKAVTRVPCLPFVILPLIRNSAHHKDSGSLHALPSINPTRTSYILDPEKNLPTTRETLSPIFEKFSNMFGCTWKGVIGGAPAASFFEQSLEQENGLLVYCGHGGGEKFYSRSRIQKFDKLSNTSVILMGCSSGRLKVGNKEKEFITHGVSTFEPEGVVLSYLINGSPCVISNLWDVTDKDIDRFFISFLDQTIGAVNDMPCFASAVASARTVCKMRYLNGCAPVYYGIPVTTVIN